MRRELTAALLALALVACRQPVARPTRVACALQTRAGDTTRTRCDVERPPVLDLRAARVRYPDMLRSANVEGSVVARFVVDAHGKVEMAGFRAETSSHDLFTLAVKNAVSQWRFVPARNHGRAVRVWERVRVEFMLARAAEQGARPADSLRVADDGVRMVVGFAPVPRDPPRVVPAADRDSALAALLRAHPPRADSADVVCVVDEGRTDDVPTAVLAQGRTRGRLVGRSGCPETYPRSFMIQLDSLGRHVPDRGPPGYRNPVTVRVTLTPWARGLFVASVTESDGGTSARGYSTSVYRDEETGGWSSLGRMTESMILY